MNDVNLAPENKEVVINCHVLSLIVMSGFCTVPVKGI